MRLAVFSDVHANPVALDAVLADVDARGGADGYWVLGDLVSPGYDPAAIPRRLAALRNVRVSRGNTDRYTLGDRYPHLSIAEAQADPSQVPRLVRIARVGAWAHGFLAATGWLDWLAALPPDLRETLPDGTRMLGVHAAPGTDDGPGIEPDAAEDEVRALLGDCGADLVLVGHTHRASDRRVCVDGAEVRVVNVGAVTGEHPTYALLEADAKGYAIGLHRTECDMEAVSRARRAVRYDEIIRGTVG